MAVQRPHRADQSSGQSGVEAEHRELLDRYLATVKGMVVLVRFGMGVPLRDLVAVIAHVDSLAARVVAGILRDDDHWIDREVATALVQGRLPVILDVLVAPLEATFADTFLSDRAVDFINRRPEGTFPVVVANQENLITVLVTSLMPRSGWSTIFS
jgi:hypothetical protein